MVGGAVVAFLGVLRLTVRIAALVPVPVVFATILKTWPAPRDYLNTMARMDVYDHLEEADHMVRMLLPERRFT